MKSIIAIFLLVLFGTMQLMDLHILSHDSDDVADCMVCVISNDTHQDNYLVPSNVCFEEGYVIPDNKIIYSAFPLLLESFSAYSFLNKAPPAYLFS